MVSIELLADSIPGIEDVINQPTLEEGMLKLMEKCRDLASECDRLERQLSESEKRIDSLVYGYEGLMVQSVSLDKAKREVEAELDRTRQEHARELADVKFNLSSEVVALKSRLYDALLDNVEPRRKPLRITHSA